MIVCPVFYWIDCENLHLLPCNETTNKQHKVVGKCTDGVFFLILAKDKNSDIIGFHCLNHRQALVVKTLPNELNHTLKVCIEIINYVTSGALRSRTFELLCIDMSASHKVKQTEVRWFLKGNMLKRFFD